MKPEFDLSSVDFRITPLENIFLDTYLSQASGDAIKIYLYGWKSCYFDDEKGKTFDKWIEELTAILFMDKEAVEEGLKYWIDTGLIEKRVEGEECKLYFKSMLLLWSGFYGRVSKNSKSPKDPKDSKKTGNSNVQSCPLLSEDDFELKNNFETSDDSDLRNIFLKDEDFEKKSEFEGINQFKKNNTLDKTDDFSEETSKIEKRRKMFEDLEDYLSEGSSYSINLKENEILKLHEFMDKYDVEPEFFIYAYKKASDMSEASSRSLMYLTTIVENWIRFEKIVSVEKLDEYLDKQENSKKMLRKSRTETRKKRAEYVNDDKRMTRAERLKWVEDKLKESHRKSLRGVKDDGQSK